MIGRFKEFSFYFFVKLRVRTYCDIVLTRANSSVASANYVISKSIDKQKDRGKQYNQLTGNVTNYYRVRVRFIAVISVYLARILLHTVKTFVTSRTRLLPRYMYLLFIVSLPFRHCRNIVLTGHLVSLSHLWWIWNMVFHVLDIIRACCEDVILSWRFFTKHLIKFTRPYSCRRNVFCKHVWSSMHFFLRNDLRLFRNKWPRTKVFL